MSTSASSVGSGSVLWQGKPWILPAAAVRTLAVVAVLVVVILVELYTGISANAFLGLSVVVWTVLVFALVWLVSLLGLLVLRASNTYTLRDDSLELKYGLFTLRSYMIVGSGFSDLEVIESVSGRMLNYGDIVVRLQSETMQRMVKVRNPVQVGNQIRAVMARPIVRVENPSKLS
jgi:hypothetical protein